MASTTTTIDRPEPRKSEWTMGYISKIPGLSGPACKLLLAIASWENSKEGFACTVGHEVLAKETGRNRQNVHVQLQKLINIKLIKRETRIAKGKWRNNQLSVRWDRVVDLAHPVHEASMNMVSKGNVHVTKTPHGPCNENETNHVSKTRHGEAVHVSKTIHGPCIENETNHVSKTSHIAIHDHNIHEREYSKIALKKAQDPEIQKFSQEKSEGKNHKREEYPSDGVEKKVSPLAGGPVDLRKIATDAFRTPSEFKEWICGVYAEKVAEHHDGRITLFTERGRGQLVSFGKKLIEAGYIRLDQIVDILDYAISCWRETIVWFAKHDQGAKWEPKLPDPGFMLEYVETVVNQYRDCMAYEVEA